MITCNLMGGLGNQLFQIFTTISYGLQAQNQFIFSDVKTLGSGNTTIRNTYWNTFFTELKSFLFSETEPPVNIQVIKEDGFHYQDLPLHLLQNKNICLFGYFQSYKYFNKHASLIYKMLRIQHKKKDVQEKWKRELERNGEKMTVTKYLENTTSLHFRMGDYKKTPQVHPIMPYEYYQNALSVIQINSGNKWNILYFCENQDVDDVMIIITKLQARFPKYTFIRASSVFEDWEQMLLMSICKNNIIANSSFSWWAGYLNTQSDKIVCYPDVWFGEACRHNTTDLFPTSWIKINSIFAET